MHRKKMSLKFHNQAQNRCVYKNCNNRRGDEGVVLFCFPNKKKNLEKYERWCNNAGVNKESSSWRMMICNSHFHGEDYTTYEHQRLISRAIPIDYRLVERVLPFDPTKVKKFYTNNNSTKIIEMIKSEIIIKSEITIDDDCWSHNDSSTTCE